MKWITIIFSLIKIPECSLLMYKNYNYLLFVGIALIFLYLSIGKYEDFSLQKSISSCTIAKSKLKNISPQEAKKICESEIKKNR